MQNIDYQLDHIELNEKVYRLLKKMILNREFVGGQRLDLKDLSKKMNISRTPLKDAVNRLAAEGLIEVKSRSGTFVTSLTIRNITEIMEIRLMIENWCVSQLSKQDAKQLAKRLRGLLEKFSTTLNTKPFHYQDYLNFDVLYHSEIVQTNGNHLMLEKYKSLNCFLHFSRIYYYYQSFERSLTGYHEHEEFVDALEKYNLNDACTKLSEHLSYSKANMIHLLQENGGAL